MLVPAVVIREQLIGSKKSLDRIFRMKHSLPWIRQGDDKAV